MALQPCWQCLCRASERTTTLLPRSCILPTSSIAPFSTSAPRSERDQFGKMRPKVESPGYRLSFRAAKKVRPAEDKSKRPAPGERKALRKRIVLSNTNALEVPNMQDISLEILGEEGLRGQVLGIPGEVVDQLRAVEAFKPTQAWGLFWRPSMLLRQETLDYANLMEELSRNARTSRRVLVGERGSGKSFLALQAMVMGFLRRLTVINIPDGSSSSQHFDTNFNLLIWSLNVT